jgi:hypothetical protein
MGKLSRRVRRNVNRSGGAGPIAGPSGPPKMSAILLDVSEPMLEGLNFAEDPIEYRVAVEVAAVLWNASRVDRDEGGRDAFAKVLDGFGEKVNEELRAMLTTVSERCHAMYPDERRMIAGVEVVPEGPTRVTVNVLSMS